MAKWTSPDSITRPRMSLLRLVVVVIAAALFLGTEINDKFSEVGNTVDAA
jgi:hypothetical protein